MQCLEDQQLHATKKSTLIWSSSIAWPCVWPCAGSIGSLILPAANHAAVSKELLPATTCAPISCQGSPLPSLHLSIERMPEQGCCQTCFLLKPVCCRLPQSAPPLPAGPPPCPALPSGCRASWAALTSPHLTSPAPWFWPPQPSSGAAGCASSALWSPCWRGPPQTCPRLCQRARGLCAPQTWTVTLTTRQVGFAVRPTDVEDESDNETGGLLCEPRRHEKRR